MNNLYFYLSKILGPILNPSNLLIIIFVFLFIIYSIKKNKNILNFLSLNIFLIVVIALFPTGVFGLKLLEKEYLLKSGDISKYQNIKNIIVLSGQDNRILASIKLANKYPESKIFYVGGSPLLISNKDQVINARKFYQDLDFDMDRIYFLSEPRNTIESFVKIKELNLKFSETVLITTGFHMKRSMMIAKKKGVKVLPYPVNFTPISKSPFLNSYQSFNVAKNLSNFNTFFREIIGIIAVKLTL